MATNARTGDGLNAAFSPVVPIPNLIEIQLDSFRWFLEDGLRGLFRNFSPIRDFTETLELELVDYHLEQPKYSQDECRQRDMTYEAPIKVQVRLHSREEGTTREVVESEVYMGALPLMTEQGTFIINGAERVVVSQLARSPGVYFRDTIDYSGRTLFYATVIPSEGAWTDVETEVNDTITVRVGQTRKFPITTLLRALAGVADANQPTIVDVTLKEADGRTAARNILDRTSGEIIVNKGDTITGEAAKRLKRAGITERIDVYQEVPKAITDAQILELFGHRVKVDTTMSENLVGRFLVEDLKDAKEKVAVKAYKRVDQKMATDIQNLVQGEIEMLDAPRYISATLEADPIKGGDGAKEEDVVSTALLDIYRKVRPGDPATVESARNLLRGIYYDVRRYDLARVGRYKLNKKLGHRQELTVPALTRADLIAIMRYIIRLSEGDETAHVDDIDHLANKRVRSVGELLQNQLRLGFLRMEKVARERMTSVDAEHAIPQVILSVKPISASIKSFFGSSQLSQFMDQHNPLAELTHKRRLSALGPGGLSRQSAKLEVRDVHHSHYGRICPIETPEGPNIGLIGSMATYTHINEFGFLETPYYVAFEGTIFPYVVYLTADEEEDPIFAWQKVEQVLFGEADPNDTRVGQNTSRDFRELIKRKRAGTDIDALIASIAPEITTLQAEVKERQAELSKVNKEMGAQNRKLADLERDSAVLQKAADKAQKALDTIEEKVKAATPKAKSGEIEQAELEKLTADRDEARKEKATTQRKAEQAQAKLAALRAPREESRKRQQDAESERDKAQGELEHLMLKKVRLQDDKAHGWRTPGVDELAAWDVKIVPSGTPTVPGEDGTFEFEGESVQVRSRGRFPRHDKEEFAEPYSYRFLLVDISPMQVFSPATSLIPFLENDDANRALMGSNMQRQAVPVIKTDAPIVGTGLETKVAVDSGAVITARHAGRVKSVTSERIVVEAREKDDDGNPLLDEYRLENMRRSNQATCIRQVAIVKTGQRVRQGDPLADGPCTDNGRLALGQNLLVAFMTWGGYNYEDAIILSQRIVQQDIFSSIHIEKYEVEARDTKLGPEEITRDIPNVSEDSLKDLDEYGVIRIGADVGPEDILVGKVAPKSQGEQSAEERLIIAIFGKKAEETRDVSLRVPHGEKGKIIDVKVFSRFKYQCQRCESIFDYSKKPDRLLCDRCGGDLDRATGDELPAGVNQLVRVYIAQKRKIMEGDKMAGRHGNKGVISRILPVEEMPFMPDGTPVDIVLNPLGVPSRMNIGQVMETHLGLVGRVLGKRFDENIFRGDKEHQILDEIRTLVDHFRNRRLREYANTELALGLEADETASVEAVVAEIREKVAALSDEDRIALAARLAVGAEGPATESLEQDASSVTFHLSNIVVADTDAPVTADDIVDRIVYNVYKRVGLNPDTGKCQLISGQTGEPYDSETMVGQIYMMKLLHLVEDKIHARSTGPYSLVTQQPLGGKAQFGGQRFGEMEVWALEAYGAAYTLQEILTIKSDDVLGRVKTYESIVKGDQILEPGIPESFKILVNELQSLCLKVTVEDAMDHVVDLRLQEDEQLDAADRAGAPRLAQARYGGDM